MECGQRTLAEMSESVQWIRLKNDYKLDHKL